MNRRRALLIFALSAAAVSAAFPLKPANAQKEKKPPAPVAANVKRTIHRRATHRLPYGGSVTLVAPPVSSITIEGWSRSEIDIEADIELQAPTEADLDLLAAINNFAVDVDTNHVRILTSGTHDKKYLQRVAKKFPKTLIGLPWKIDFRMKIPALTDVEIDSGVGPIKLSGVEGSIRLEALQSDAELTLTGGDFTGLIQRGAVKITIPSRNWRGLGATLQLAGGSLEVILAPGFSGDVDANVLRLGEVKNSYAGLTPREGAANNPRLLLGRAGAGGAKLSFTVGDGTLEIKSLSGGQ
ncbi:MAG TPA: hypothetical protein VGW32_04735 [Pyrinomonadaceae bacterium]|nr:hypothetical protein [Pyrinomonadaceae bacterium]